MSYILITLVVEFPLIIIYLNMSRVFVACFQVVGVIFFFKRKKWKVVHKRLIIDQNVITGGFSVLDIVQKIPQEKLWKTKCYINIRDTCQRFRRILQGPFCGVKVFYCFHTQKHTNTQTVSCAAFWFMCLT